MALLKDIALDNGQHITYHKINDIKLDSSTLEITATVTSYTDETYRQAEKDDITNKYALVQQYTEQIDALNVQMNAKIEAFKTATTQEETDQLIADITAIQQQLMEVNEAKTQIEGDIFLKKFASFSARSEKYKFDIDGIDFRNLVYSKLKELDTFQGSVDILEEGGTE